MGKAKQKAKTSDTNLPPSSAKIRKTLKLLDEIEERGEQPPKMDVFISRYDNLYQEDNWGLKYGERVDEEEEWPIEDCEGVEGYYYDGGSFEPFEEFGTAFP